VWGWEAQTGDLDKGVTMSATWADSISRTTRTDVGVVRDDVDATASGIGIDEPSRRMEVG
jgi:hypothetical protein